MKTSKTAITNRWAILRKYTDARIALGRTGTSLPTSELLAFQFDHANAQDAVHIPLDPHKLITELTSQLPTILLTSKAQSRTQYLQRPDYGRVLSNKSRESLSQYRKVGGYDIAFAIADGLSSIAVQRHAPKMLAHLLDHFKQSTMEIAPITIVLQGRVAVSDDIANALNAKCVVLLIGERPGLSSPDSLGIYYTFAPRPGLKDDSRNCISNIRDGGLSYAEAKAKVIYLVTESLKLGKSGVALKDKTAPAIETTSTKALENKYLFPIGKK